MATDNSQAIANNSLAPKTATVDGQTVTQHDITQQIEADKYARKCSVVSNPFAALRRAKIIPPGAV